MGLFDFFKSKPAEQEVQISEESSVAILHDDGIRAMKMGEVKYAEKCFAKALELRDDLQLVKLLAEVKLRLQDFEEALPLLQRVAEAEPENVEAQLLLGQTYGKLGDYATMKAIADKLQESLPEDARVLYIGGEADQGVGDVVSAIARLTKAIELQPLYSAPRLLRAQILSGMGQYKEVLEDTEVLLKQDSEREEVLLLQANSLVALGETEKAEAVYARLLEANPFSRDGVIFFAEFYCRTSRIDKALELCNEAIELQPDFARAYQLRANIKMQLNDKIGADEDLKKSMELQSESFEKADGEFSNVENKVAERYRNMNPYGF